MSCYTSELIAKVLDSSEISFTISDTPLTTEQALSNDGALPLFAYIANNICQQHMGVSLGIEVSPKEEGLYGVTVEFDESTPVSTNLLFLLEAVTAYSRKELGIHAPVFEGGLDDLKGKVVSLDNLADYLHQLSPELSVDDFFVPGNIPAQPVQPNV